MSTSDRRDFIKQSGTGMATALVTTLPAIAGERKPAADLRVGVIGAGGRGRHISQLAAEKDGVEVSHVCDPDQQRLDKLAKILGVKPANSVSDMRRVLDDPTVDAVLVATPDHWHAPAAILACDAGKHVYVEKPCSHNIREGRLLVEAARRNDRVVQHGTQVRSTTMMQEATQLLHGGVIGDVLVARVWNVQKRDSIGRGKNVPVPPGIDFDLWVGPAPMRDYRSNLLHGHWHWWADFGTGDMGNDGVHDLDYGRWGLGVEMHPTKISAAGGKYFFDDDQQFADTQQVSFEYPGDGRPGSQRMLIYEQRLWSTNYPSVYNVDSGVEFYGTDGRMFLSRRGKIQVLDSDNKRIAVPVKPLAQNASAHMDDFIDSIRNERRPNADIEIGHLSASLAHLGNMATRLGRSLQFDPEAERIVNDPEADLLVGRTYRDHWAVPQGVG
ncbi:MAG: Gfo/Idh/MocA family oxidoreductase [Pirellulales bacterium]|nr:Gfo/Idh/MocA family oxidoreductase [Pirellulales bacterium]